MTAVPVTGADQQTAQDRSESWIGHADGTNGQCTLQTTHCRAGQT